MNLRRMEWKSSIGGRYRARTEREAAGMVLARCARVMRGQVLRSVAVDALGLWTGEVRSRYGVTVHSFAVEPTGKEAA